MNRPPCRLTIAATTLALTAGVVIAAAPAPAPVQAPATPTSRPWSNAAGDVRLSRPLAAVPGRSDAPLGSLMTSGWRLVWDGTPVGPGTVVVRLALKVRPSAPYKTATEVLQVGRSRDPQVVRNCLTQGLGGAATRQPDRTIHRRLYAVWRNADAGMSQAIRATSLRTVANRTCYAVERFAYAESASDGDSAVTLPQTAGAAQLDAALASLRIGPPR